MPIEDRQLMIIDLDTCTIRDSRDDGVVAELCDSNIKLM
jgi:hypothetical protein